LQHFTILPSFFSVPARMLYRTEPSYITLEMHRQDASWLLFISIEAHHPFVSFKNYCPV